MFETFDHTADVGLRARAGGVAELFEEAARALFSVIVVNLEAVRPLQEITLRIDGRDLADLLHDWLGELLYRFDTQHLLLADFEVALDADGLSATARGEPVDPARHSLDAEVKAITYHGLKVERDADGWLAEVIVDL